MSSPRLQLPTLQNWNCHNCGGCCREHAIEITEDERLRIVEQGWQESGEIPSQQPLFKKTRESLFRTKLLLAHREDGACVFLDSKGLCKIHAKFGEQAKPLACRIYPYAFHPAGKAAAVSLRFSCPSVVGNLGKPVAKQSTDLRIIGNLVVPEGYQKTPPPSLFSKTQLDWGDFQKFISCLDQTFATEHEPFTNKLIRALSWINLVEQSQFESIKGKRLEEYLHIITEAAADESLSENSDMEEPSKPGKVQFRLLLAQYARKDTAAQLSSGWRGRLNLFKAAIRFSRGKGLVPPLQEVFSEVPFLELEKPFGKIPAEAEELFTRYFRVKIQGIHFCGPAYYGTPLVEGFRSLALIYPAVMWLARWLAASDERTTLCADDVARALAIADHHHGYSPIFGSLSFRSRVRTLQKLGDIEKLINWYCR